MSDYYFVVMAGVAIGVVMTVVAGIVGATTVFFSSPQPTKATVMARAIADRTNLRIVFPSSKKWFTCNTFAAL